MSPPRRWPLHPQPGPLESLSSWVSRLARLYRLPVKDLFEHNLGLVGVTMPADLDWDPPAVLLDVLAERTGVPVVRLRAMTLAGWEPWLFDTVNVRRHNTQETFETYVRSNSVLLAPGAAGTHIVDGGYRQSWPGPWLLYRGPRRACPVCATEPDRGECLFWRLPLTAGCPEHGCRLVEATSIARRSPSATGWNRCRSANR